MALEYDATLNSVVEKSDATEMQTLIDRKTARKTALDARITELQTKSTVLGTEITDLTALKTQIT